MVRPRLRLSGMLWLVATVAAFLGGMRYGEYRAAPHWRTITVHSANGSLDLQQARFDVNSPDGAKAFERHLALVKSMKSRYTVTTDVRQLAP